MTLNQQVLTFHSPQERESGRFQSLCAIHEVREIETRDVVSNHNVGINLFNKVPPRDQHF